MVNLFSLNYTLMLFLVISFCMHCSCASTASFMREMLSRKELVESNANSFSLEKERWGTEVRVALISYGSVGRSETLTEMLSSLSCFYDSLRLDLRRFGDTERFINWLILVSYINFIMPYFGLFNNQNDF